MAKKNYTAKVLENYKKILVSELKKELNKPGSNLEKSIVGRKIPNRDGFKISMNEYALNVNQGRSAGKLPNMGNLEDWIDRNQSKLGIKDATPKGLRKVLFAIGNSIKKRGIRPYRFIDIVIDKFESRMTMDLVDAYRREIQEEIDAATPTAKKS
tara:strand:+ start:173 stop:637 length:465 start_codon:yes stop_codon:yes gene_type:complete